MKKIISIITAVVLLTVLIFTGKSYAASLDAIDIQTDKTTVRPGEEVKVTINFGQTLGAYTFDIAYDNNIFEYVSVDGGTPNDTSDKVRVVFHDSSGGTNSRANMSITFRAKSDITTSNPTEFSITAEGLANADASVNYDDITTPIVKNVTVEPQYVDYTLNLEQTGDIIKGEENAMTLSYSSSMGRYYEHARLIAEATTTTGGNVQLLATDESSLEHDIIQSGWGDAQGYKIGGKDVSQVLNVRGVFSEVGDYQITLKLIDRDNSDSIIAEKTFGFTVVENSNITPPEEITPPAETPGTTEEEEKIENEIVNQETNEEINQEETPTKLPKTGYNVYVPILVILMAVLSSYLYYNKKRK